MKNKETFGEPYSKPKA